MPTYTPPVKDMLFALNHVTGIHHLPQVQRGELDAEMIEVVPNPVSLIEALRDPFRRLSAFLGNQWEKLTRDLESKSSVSLSSAAASNVDSIDVQIKQLKAFGLTREARASGTGLLPASHLLH